MKQIKFTKEKIGLLLILLLSGMLNFANLSIEGYGNEYYAAGVKSMLMNFKNFFFVSYDPAGFVSIDKPPLGFWIQTISAKIFGFSGWSILLPQALAGVISVALIYYIVKRSFGYAAGIISALCLTITPVFVATSRNNTIDNLLVMTLLISCIFLSKAAEKGKLKYLIISMILIGLGFNIKMLQAYMILPAVYVTYLLSSALPVKIRIKHIIIASVILITISFSWAVAVDLIPSQSRPFVGSSTNNTVMELILGHNGIERLSSSSGGMMGGGGPGTNNGMNRGKGYMPQFSGERPQVKQNRNQQFPGKNGINGKANGENPGGNMGGAPGNGMNGLSGSFGGQINAGLTRLFSKNVLSDQIVWFLPLSLLAIIASIISGKIRLPFNNREKLNILLWSLWLIPEFIYFSYTKGLFHPYYLTMLAPPIAALTGIGLVKMWNMYHEKGIKGYLLPVSLAVEGLTHLLMLSYFKNSLSSSVISLILLALIICLASSLLLTICRIFKHGQNKKLVRVLAVIGIIGIMTTPAIAASAALTHSLNSSIPSNGLELLSNSSTSGNFNMKAGKNGNSNKKIIEFLDKNIKNEKYALVVSSANSAGSMIIESGKSIMPIGGFSGSDNILSLNEFKELVKKGEVRYVLTGGIGRSSDEIMNWVAKNGKVVPSNEWNDTNNTNDSNNKNKNKGLNNMEMNSQTLYDLKGSVK